MVSLKCHNHTIKLYFCKANESIAVLNITEESPGNKGYRTS